MPTTREQIIRIPFEDMMLDGNLELCKNATGIVVFAHGSGSSRFSPRNRQVAQALNQAGFATLLFDLLTPQEEKIDSQTAQYRFDIPMLAKRLVGVSNWINHQPALKSLKIGYFGASTGAGAALIAAVERPKLISAVVSRGGRPDLAEEILPRVKAPTLLIVGELDDVVIMLNRKAQAQMKATTKLEIVPGATHLFEEPGTLDKVVELAKEWFKRYL